MLEEALTLRIRALEAVLAEYRRGNAAIRARFCPTQVGELRGTLWLMKSLLELHSEGVDVAAALVGRKAEAA